MKNGQTIGGLMLHGLDVCVQAAARESMADRKDYKDPKPAKVDRLLTHLARAGDLYPIIDLDVAGYVDGWRIVREVGDGHGGRAVLFRVYRDDTPPHDASIRWAVRPSVFGGTHGELVEYLRAEWYDVATKWLEGKRSE